MIELMVVMLIACFTCDELVPIFSGMGVEFGDKFM